MSKAARFRPWVGDWVSCPAHPLTPRMHPVPFPHLLSRKLTHVSECISDSPSGNANGRLLQDAAIARV